MRRLVLLLLLVVLAACARPALEPLPLPPGLKQELLGTLLTQGEHFTSLKGMASMKLRYGAQNMNFSSVVVLEKPDKMRFEIVSMFGSSYLQASSDGEQLNLYLPGKRRFFSGPPNTQNLQFLTQMPIELKQMVALLLYEVPLISLEVSDLRARDHDGYALTLVKGEQRQELWFDLEKRLLASYWYRDNTLEAKVVYGDFESGSGFPLEVSVRQPLSDSSLQARFESPATNVAISAKLFKLKPPAGVTVEPFPVLAAPAEP